MSINNCFIFRSGELYLTASGTVPTELPPAFVPFVTDSLDLVLTSGPSRAVLLSDSLPSSSVVSASVSDSGKESVSASMALFPRWLKLRELIASGETAQNTLAKDATRALGLINWHNSHRFCTRCGSPCTDHPNEIARVCTACAHTVYPRLSPAIIVLVQKEGKILLARHAERNQDLFSCIAGYVEHGETLEECVKREVAEETGLCIENIRYAGSQSWPYPDQYMIAFYADWKSGEINVDPSEILEARWFDRNNLPHYPMPGTVAERLINGVLNVLSKK